MQLYKTFGKDFLRLFDASFQENVKEFMFLKSENT